MVLLIINWKKLKNQIPSSFKIKGKTWEVLWIEEFEENNDGTRNIGETRFIEKQVVLAKKLSPKLTVHTFIHEIFHVISYDTNANLTEKQVLALEKATPYLLEIFKGLNS